MKNSLNSLLIIGSLLCSCQLESPVALSGSPRVVGDCAVCGTWTYSSSENRGANQYVSIYTKTNDFTNQSGLKFLADGQFVERANSGWCGTPPISYADYTGRWRPEGDSLAVDGQYWGGLQRSKIAVVSVDPNRLVIQRVYKR